MLLKQPIKKVVHINLADSHPSNVIKLTPEEEKAINHPYLYGSALENM
jgi:hypothetical protein